MRERVVCDTSILISALIFPGGSPDEVVNLTRTGEVNLYISPFILNEFERVLKEKFNYSEGEAKESRASQPLLILPKNSRSLKKMNPITGY